MHSHDINERVLHIPPCFDTLDANKENNRECYEVFYDDLFNIEDVDLSHSLLNPHVPNQTILENQEKLNT